MEKESTEPNSDNKTEEVILSPSGSDIDSLIKIGFVNREATSNDDLSPLHSGSRRLREGPDGAVSMSTWPEPYHPTPVLQSYRDAQELERNASFQGGGGGGGSQDSLRHRPSVPEDEGEGRGGEGGGGTQDGLSSAKGRRKTSGVRRKSRRRKKSGDDASMTSTTSGDSTGSSVVMVRKRHDDGGTATARTSKGGHGQSGSSDGAAATDDNADDGKQQQQQQQHQEHQEQQQQQGHEIPIDAGTGGHVRFSGTLDDMRKQYWWDRPVRFSGIDTMGYVEQIPAMEAMLDQRSRKKSELPNLDRAERQESVNQYLERHNIVQLLQFMMNSVMAAQPGNPASFLHDMSHDMCKQQRDVEHMKETLRLAEQAEK